MDTRSSIRFDAGKVQDINIGTCFSEREHTGHFSGLFGGYFAESDSEKDRATEESTVTAGNSPRHPHCLLSSLRVTTSPVGLSSYSLQVSIHRLSAYIPSFEHLR